MPAFDSTDQHDKDSCRICNAECFKPKNVVTKYVIQTHINSLTPFHATDAPYTSCTGSLYITLAYVHTHMKLFHNTSYAIR
jgi:hypothetical protein